jgi:Phospholipase/Carboxylesterase
MAKTTENGSNDRKWLKRQKMAQTTENGSNDRK